MKKKICFIGRTEKTCNYIAKQLEVFLGDYSEVLTCPIEKNTIPLAIESADIYVATSSYSLEKIKSSLCITKPTLIAKRTLNIEKLNKLLEIKPNTRALLVQTSKEMAMESIDIINSFGIKHFSLIPYYPGCPIHENPDIDIAVTTGMTYLIPTFITKVIDLGTNNLDISTYSEICEHLDISRTVLNTITHKYIESVLRITLERLKLAQENEDIKYRIEVIFNTINEAIFAVDQYSKTVFINTTAQNILNIPKCFSPDDKMLSLLNINKCMESRLPILHEIKKINKNYYILNTNPIVDGNDRMIGAVTTLNPAKEVQEMESKVRHLLKDKGYIARYTFKDIIGDSEEILKSIQLAKKFAQTDLHILLVGESGTGKELFAQAIHNESLRKNAPFIAVNFAAMHENLVESELFGYIDGAFTGAKKGGKAGLFEEAHTGTIFLDEIGDASLQTQKKLLRVLEQQEVRRIGGNTITPIDVRIIAATNQDLTSLIEQGLFRADLFYRISTVPLSLPPLRIRKQDILFYIEFIAQSTFKRPLYLDSALKEFMLSYNWPGNVRELKNVINYLCNITPVSSVASIKDLPQYLVNQYTEKLVNTMNNENTTINTPANKDIDDIYCLLNNDLVFYILDEINKAMLIQSGLGRKSLQKKIASHGIHVTENKVRMYLKKLEEREYISIGKTKQGSYMTQKGRNLYETLMIHRKA